MEAAIKIPVIVVDDDSTDRYIVGRQLSKSALFGEILEASTGVEFLDKYTDRLKSANNDETPTIVLMDINMPLMNGFETVAELQRRLASEIQRSKIDIFMYSSSAREEDKSRSENFALVKGYIVKPFEQDDITWMENFYSFH